MARKLHDWNAVQAYRDQGHAFVERSAIRFWAHRVDQGDQTRQAARGAYAICGPATRYDWAEVQAYYDAGHSDWQTAAYFGFCSAAWFKACQHERSHLKARLIKGR
jgi:hypothetical protein